MRHFIVVGGMFALAGMCANANAQENAAPYLAQHVSAPSHALELKVATGYTQGLGNLSPTRPVSDASHAGIGLGVDIDYRLDRPWSIGVEGQYQEFSHVQNASARGLALNVGATYHFNPVLRGDPWLRLGTGYRLFYENDPTGQAGGTWTRHGFDLATAKVGYDVRISEDVAIAPVIGADVNLFVWEIPGNGTSQAMSSARAATFLYAGLQGRFDIGGDRGGLVAKAAPPPLPEPVGVAVLQPPSPPAETPQPVSPSLAASEDIVRACKLNLDAVEKAPKFEFDRADLLPADYDILKQIATCFTVGPLKDGGMRLVGRADPRGTIPYNQELGLKRANSVAAFLGQYGIETSRIESVSRGKLDATGRDEATWAVDRRVDILER